jgi:hypothetical protein
VLAINIADTERLDPESRQKFFAGRLHDKFIDMRFDRAKDGDEAAVAFKCDLLTACIICDMIRSRDREMGDNPTRLYLKRTSWSRVPNNVVLTVMINGKCRFNPDFFPVKVDLGSLKPPTPLTRR